MRMRSIRLKLKFAGRLKQNRSDFFKPALQGKTLIIIFLLLTVLITSAGCDFLQDEEGEIYDLPVKVELENPAMLENADLREMEVELGTSSIDESRYDFWREDGEIKGEIYDLQDRVTVTIKHPMLGAAGKRVGSDHSSSETVFTLPGIETRLEFEVEQLPLHQFINIPGEEDLYFYRLSLHDKLEQLERLDWVETAVFVGAGNEILTEKKIDHNFYLLADPATEDQVADAELALLNEDRIIQARGEFSVSERDLLEGSEDEPDLIVNLRYDSGEQLSTASPLQTANYLNRIKLYDGENILIEHESDTDEVIFENFSKYDRDIELDEVDLMTDGLPGSYLTVAGVITDIDDLLHDDGGQAFRDMVSGKMEKHNHQFEEMDLFVKLDNIDHSELLGLGAAGAGEVWSTLEEILTEIDGSWMRQMFAGIEFTYGMGKIVEGEAEITYFDVVVEEVYGYQDARSFTLGDGDRGYTNTSQEFGEELTQTTDPDNGEMYIYALESDPDTHNPDSQ